MRKWTAVVLAVFVASASGCLRAVAAQQRAYFANGAGGQCAIIIPTHDLVVVRMGHHRAGMQALRAALAELMLAVPRQSETLDHGRH
jgi:CubicO group peptidase (beta-lactamase class C family)